MTTSPGAGGAGATRFLREERGAAMVEFALILFLLLILVFGIIDFGRAIYTANSLNLAAREGARFAAVVGDPMANPDAIKDTVIHHMTPFGGDPIDPLNVTITPNYAAGSPTSLQSVTVRVDYPFHMLTPIGSLLNLSPDTLHASAQFRWEQAATGT